MSPLQAQGCLASSIQLADKTLTAIRGKEFEKISTSNGFTYVPEEIDDYLF